MTFQARGLSLALGGNLILDGVDIDLSLGRVALLAGPNGSGKSTLFDVLSGFRGPDRGEVSLDGHTLTGRGPELCVKSGVVRTFQRQRVAWNATILENIATASDWTDRSGDQSWLKPAMRSLGLSDVATNPTYKLSFGQQRLTAVLRALAAEPKVLLLDEPLAGIRPDLRGRLLGILYEAVERGLGLVIIEHDLASFGSIPAEGWLMNKGRMKTFRTTREMANSEDFAECYLGRTPSAGDGIAAAQGSQVRVPAASRTAASNSRTRREVGETDSQGLALFDVSYGYASRPVITDVSIRLRPGDISFVVGGNGSGKSTLLKGIAGLIPEMAGRIDLSGAPLVAGASLRARAGIRLLPQTGRLFPSLSVQENETVAQLVLGPLVSPIDDRYAYRRAGTLSGGEIAEIALRFLGAGNPQVILLDEPTAGLSHSKQDELAATLQCWQRQGVALLVAEHNISFARSLATHIYLAKQGRLSIADPGSLTSDRVLVDALLDRNQ